MLLARAEAGQWWGNRFKKVRKCFCVGTVAGRQERAFGQSSSGVTKVSEGGAGEASGAGAEIPWQPMGEDCGEPGCALVVCGGPR